MNNNIIKYVAIGGLAFTLLFALYGIYSGPVSDVEELKWCEVPTTVEETIQAYKPAIERNKEEYAEQEQAIVEAKAKQARLKEKNTLYRSIISDVIGGTHDDLLALGFGQSEVDALRLINVASSIEEGYSIGSQRKKEDINMFVIHHTATRADLTAEQMELSMRRRRIENAGGNIIPTHYIIDASGKTLQVNDDLTVVGGTRDGHANIHGIHVEVVGNFNEHDPTDEQYKALSILRRGLEEKYGPIETSGHREHSATACPGERMDFTKIDDSDNYLGNFMTTSYYSPTADQKRTFFSHKLGRRRTIQEEIRMNCGWRDELSLEENAEACKYPANGRELLNSHTGKLVACDPRIPLGSTLLMKGYGIVTCVDRGGAITHNRIDMWSGYGDVGLENIEKGKLGVPKYVDVYLLD